MASTIKHLLGNGVQEIRFAFSQTAPASNSLRQFVANTYPQLKSLSPSFPVLVRESANSRARITARYDFGVEQSVEVEESSSPADIEKSFVQLIKRAEGMPRSDESKQDKQIKA